MIEERRPGTNPLLETRGESHESVDKSKRYEQILEILSSNHKPLTAKEISVLMYNKGYSYSDERNVSAPRITELLKMGKIDCVGKKICQYTGKKVGAFVIRKTHYEQCKMEF